MPRIADARIGETRPRDYQISLDGVIADLTGLTIQLHKRTVGDIDFVTYQTERDSQIYVKDATNGIVGILPDDTFWDTEGEQEMYFEILDSPVYFSPETEMLQVLVKPGIKKTSVIVYPSVVETTFDVVAPVVVIT